ncbi:hypothetical protein ACVW00_004214 [Marmoricola sp. URHA0025 HA25]
METNGGAAPSPEDASAALLDAAAAREHLAAAIVLPSFFFTSLATAVAVQIMTTALGVTVYTTPARVAFGAGLVAFCVVAAVQLVRFRRVNGVWVGGIASRVVFGSATGPSTVHVLAMAAAIGAAIADAWWLVALCAVTGGIAYAVTGARWMRAYRDAPDRHSRAESALLLVALALPAVGALVLLVAEH